MISFFFFFNDTATTEIYTLSLHDALPTPHKTLHHCYKASAFQSTSDRNYSNWNLFVRRRSEEHTSELQSRLHLVCRLLLEKKKKKKSKKKNKKNKIKKKIR